MKKDVEAFRIFVQKHPKLIKEVRSNTRTWREIYEDWFILGESHECWENYRSEQEYSLKEDRFRGLKERKQQKAMEEKELKEEKKTKKDITVGDVFSMFRDINVSDLQQHIVQFSGAIEGIHQLLQQFQGSKTQQGPQSKPSEGYFSVFKD